VDEKDARVSGNVADVVGVVAATNVVVSAAVDSTAIKYSYYPNGSIQCSLLL